MITETLKEELKKKELRCACGEILHVNFQRNQNLWAVTHGLGNGKYAFEGKTCPLRWKEFGRSRKKDEGGTPEEALERARETLTQNTNDNA